MPGDVTPGRETESYPVEDSRITHAHETTSRSLLRWCAVAGCAFPCRSPFHRAITGGTGRAGGGCGGNPASLVSAVGGVRPVAAADGGDAGGGTGAVVGACGTGLYGGDRPAGIAADGPRTCISPQRPRLDTRGEVPVACGCLRFASARGPSRHAAGCHWPAAGAGGDGDGQRGSRGSAARHRDGVVSEYGAWPGAWLYPTGQAAG